MSEHDTTPGPLAPVGDGQIVTLTPMELIASAVQAGAVDPNALEKLMDLQERWEAKLALRAYQVALAEFQAEVPPIPADGTGAHKVPYSTWPGMRKHIAPYLERHGLTLTHEQEIGETTITVTAVVTHSEGHVQRHHWSAVREEVARIEGRSAGWKAIQSATTFGTRQVSKMALGLVESREFDDDGQRADVVPATGQQISQLLDLVNETGTSLESFLGHFGVDELEAFPAGRVDEAVEMLTRRLEVLRARQRGET